MIFRLFLKTFFLMLMLGATPVIYTSNIPSRAGTALTQTMQSELLTHTQRLLQCTQKKLAEKNNAYDQLVIKYNALQQSNNHNTVLLAQNETRFKEIETLCKQLDSNNQAICQEHAKLKEKNRELETVCAKLLKESNQSPIQRPHDFSNKPTNAIVKGKRTSKNVRRRTKGASTANYCARQ